MKGMIAAGCFVSCLAHANPAIDMEGYLRVSREAAEHREMRRVSEADFIRMSREPGTMVIGTCRSPSA